MFVRLLSRASVNAAAADVGGGTIGSRGGRETDFAGSLLRLRWPVAIDGDSIIVTGARLSGDPQFPNLDRVAFLFERTSAGAWVFVRKLIETSEEAELASPMAVAMNGGVAAFAVGRVHVFERTAAGWVSVPSTGFSQGRDVEVHSGMILASEGDCAFDAELYEKQASGTWTITRTFSGPPRDEGCDDEFLGRDVDITSNRVILGAPVQQQTQAQAHIWNRNPDGSWPLAATSIIPAPSGPGSIFADQVTIEGDFAIASAVLERTLCTARER